jgi:xylose dehydrogenase (NAD/NADP)
VARAGADVEVEEVRGRGEREIHRVEGANEYVRMVEHFADCVLHDRPPRYAAAEAAANMRVIEALYRSARDGGRPVAL